jgi:amino acid transporter
MKIVEFLLSPIFRAILIVLLLPLLLLSAFRYSAYILFIFFFCLFAISGMFARLKKSEHRLTRQIWRLSILLVVVWASFCICPEFNLWLTLSARQRVINGEDIYYPVFLLSEVTFVGDSVYFAHFKRGRSLWHESAFFVYKSSPGDILSIDINLRHERWKQLKDNWFFLVTTYAD